MYTDQPKPIFDELFSKPKRDIKIFRLKVEFEFDLKYITFIPSVNLNRHVGEIEFMWLFFGMYIGKPFDLTKHLTKQHENNSVHHS